MRKIAILPHGFTIGTIDKDRRQPEENERGEIGGWTQKSTRGNIAFLRSINEKQLTGVGFACTFTLGICPSTPALWHKLRKAFDMRLRRLGMIRYHWVTEWQRRGVPHLHACIFFDDAVHDYIGKDIVEAWLCCASDYLPDISGQHCAHLHEAIGWFQYVSKHSARGIYHYQRSSGNVPIEWNKKTGRVWGKCGSWPVDDAIDVYPDDAAFFMIRRIVKRWRLADSRASGSARRILSARRYLQAPENLSRVIGVSEWMPRNDLLKLLDFLNRSGYCLDSA